MSTKETVKAGDKFNLEMALAGAPLVTRGGLTAINFKHDPGEDDGELNYSFQLSQLGSMWTYFVTKDGVCLPHPACKARDLFMAKSEVVPVTEEVTI